MPEGPEIRRAADRISKVLIGEEIIESNFYYERIKEKEEIVKNQNIKHITKQLEERQCLSDSRMIGQCIAQISYMEDGQ